MNHKKKHIKIIISMALILTLLATNLSPFSQVKMSVQAASEPQATVTKYTLFLGYKDYQINIKNAAKTATVTYVSSDKAVASVSKDGLVKPLTLGKAVISVKIYQNKKYYTSKINVTVKNSYMDINKKRETLYVGDIYTFMATAYGIDYKTVYWSSSNKAVATIDKSSGQLKALSAGTTVITAKDDKSRVKAELTVTVKAIETVSPTPTLAPTVTPPPKVTYTPPVGSDKAVYLSGLDLSKETGVYYTTTKEEYIQTTRFNLYLDNNVQVPVNVIDLINYIMDTIEDTTGYQFYIQHYNNEKFYKGMDYELKKYFENADTFKVIDSKDERVDIVVADNIESSSYYSIAGGVLLSPEYIKLIDGNAGRLIHELIHNIFFLNGCSLGSGLNDGYADYYTAKIIEKDTKLHCTFDTYNSIKNYKSNISEETIEEMFFNSNTGQSGTKLGFRLTTYIMEKYGDSAYRKMRNYVSKNIIIKNNPSLEKIAELIKDSLSESFFIDFTKWHKQNLSRFGDVDLSAADTWEISNGILYNYYGKDSNVIIPNSVIEIQPEIFMNNNTMVSVEIPYSVIIIRATAFYNCDKLTEITIPNSVMDLAYSTFKDCNNLKKVVLSNNLITIPMWTFKDCTSLSDIQIPSGIIIIENSAFYNCSALETIKLPNTLETIERNAFSNSGLKSIIIPDSVTTLEEAIFMDSRFLKDVTLPKSLKVLSDSTFWGCKSLQKITLPNGLLKIGAAAFYFSGLTEVTIPSSVTTIGDSAFANCTRLKSITIPKSVKSMGNETFSNCKQLTIYGEKGSYAEKYAKNRKIKFSVIKN